MWNLRDDPDGKQVWRGEKGAEDVAPKGWPGWKTSGGGEEEDRRGWMGGWEGWREGRIR